MATLSRLRPRQFRKRAFDPAGWAFEEGGGGSTPTEATLAGEKVKDIDRQIRGFVRREQTGVIPSADREITRSGSSAG